MLALNSLMIGSEDPKRLADFYGQVLQSKPGWEDSGYTGYQAGSCYLMVGPHDKVRGQSTNPERVIFNFETTEVDAEFTRIKALPGATVVQDPYSPGENSSMKLATLADPDGNYFQLATPMM